MEKLKELEQKCPRIIKKKYTHIQITYTARKIKLKP